MKYDYKGNHIVFSTVYEAQAIRNMTDEKVRAIRITKETRFPLQREVLPKGIIINFLDKVEGGYTIAPFNCREHYALFVPGKNVEEIM